MNQIVHIFRKDTRHCWPEIVLSLAITAALVCIYPLRWLALPGRDALGIQMPRTPLSTSRLASAY